MTQANLLEKAKRGDAKAIASVMNYLLQDKGITAQATLKGGCLQVVLESAQVPEQESSVAFIRQAMMKLGVESVKYVKVQGKKTGQHFPTWTESLNLNYQVEEPKEPGSALEPAKQGNQKASGALWPAWFPYPSSWVRAFILVPIAFPGARFIFLAFGGLLVSAITASPVILIVFAGLGLLVSTIILSFVYQIFWFSWKKPVSSTRKLKWVTGSSSLWEGFYATAVTGLSFMAVLTLLGVLAFLSCYLSHSAETAVEVARCSGREIGRAAGGIFGSTDNVWNFSGRGVVIREEDDFAVRPWFVIWLIIAAYLYQFEYLIRSKFMPALKRAIR
ncbi:MAG: hypothetical protein MUC60_01255 [Oscillatoria sp. Prado101]|jgi:hypothetical protein|nr:hypothetical protein [Oscillatoria sp. Prado101]